MNGVVRHRPERSLPRPVKLLFDRFIRMSLLRLEIAADMFCLPVYLTLEFNPFLDRQYTIIIRTRTSFIIHFRFYRILNFRQNITNSYFFTTYTSLDDVYTENKFCFGAVIVVTFKSPVNKVVIFRS